MIQWWQILLLTLYAGFQIMDELHWYSSAGSAVFSGFITGLIMGDMATGLFIGGSMQLTILGVGTFGGASRIDANSGTLIATAFAVSFLFPLPLLPYLLMDNGLMIGLARLACSLLTVPGVLALCVILPLVCGWLLAARAHFPPTFAAKFLPLLLPPCIYLFLLGRHLRVLPTTFADLADGVRFLLLPQYGLFFSCLPCQEPQAGIDAGAPQGPCLPAADGGRLLRRRGRRSVCRAARHLL